MVSPEGILTSVEVDSESVPLAVIVFLIVPVETFTLFTDEVESAAFLLLDLAVTTPIRATTTAITMIMAASFLFECFFFFIQIPPSAARKIQT